MIWDENSPVAKTRWDLGAEPRGGEGGEGPYPGGIQTNNFNV